MRKRKRYLANFYLSIFCLIGLIYLVLSFPPDFVIKFDRYASSILPLFFVLTFLTLYFLSSFIFGSIRRGIFLAFFAVCFLLLRLNGLVSLFFLGLLIILLGALELFFVKKK